MGGLVVTLAKARSVNDAKHFGNQSCTQNASKIRANHSTQHAQPPAVRPTKQQLSKALVQLCVLQGKSPTPTIFKLQVNISHLFTLMIPSEFTELMLPCRRSNLLNRFQVEIDHEPLSVLIDVQLELMISNSLDFTAFALHCCKGSQGI